MSQLWRVIKRDSEKKSGLTLSSGFYAHWTTSISCNALSLTALDSDRQLFAKISTELRDARLTFLITNGEIEIATPLVLASNCAKALLGIDNNFALVLCGNNADVARGLQLHGL